MKLIKKHKYLIILIFLIFIIVYLIFIKQKLKDNKYPLEIKEENISIKTPVKKEIKNEQKKTEMCYVDIKGAVLKPGVYYMNCDKRINDAITLAGGLKPEANTSVINLAKKIINEMVIIIYTNQEVKNSNIVDTVVKVVEKECKCPNIKNDGCINDKLNQFIGEENNSNKEIDNKDNINNKKININTASIDELMNIPKIGESKANLIIEYRKKNGNFKTIKDIINVSGIGDKLYEEIKIYITT